MMPAIASKDDQAGRIGRVAFSGVALREGGTVMPGVCGSINSDPTIPGSIS